MKPTQILALAAGLVLVLAGRVAAETLQAAELDFVAKEDAVTEAAYAEITPTTLTVPEGKQLVAVFLEFEAALAPGQEVELWLDTGTEQKPWEEREDYVLRKAHWVADERTGGLVRLDIADLAQAWTTTTATPPKLLIRIAPDGEGVVADFQPGEGAKARVVLRTR